MGGTYQFSEPVEVASISTYAHALQQCIHRYPQLSAAIGDPDSESPYYKFCPRLDLREHVNVLEYEGGSEINKIKNALPEILDTTWTPGFPPWKIFILPFSRQRCFIAFSFSHALGDGMSAMSFHQTFLDGLQETHVDGNLICTPTMKPLSQPFDTSKNLPISWSFLLSPLLGAYLPKGLASLFGLKASAASITPDTWTGSPHFYDAEKYKTGLEVLSIDAAVINKGLNVCRSHGTRLTGVLHQFINAALSKSLPQPNNVDSFASGTALNMRGAAGISKDQMGNCVSSKPILYPITKTPEKEQEQQPDWDLAKSTTESLAAAANELRDQPVGLLRYLKEIRPWLLSKIGQPRDSSYEVSNLVTFQRCGPTDRCSITEMVFSQPADVSGGPLTFNLVSVPNGPLSIVVNWQIGGLNVGSEKDERAFVSSVCADIERSFALLASISKS